MEIFNFLPSPIDPHTFQERIADDRVTKTVYTGELNGRPPLGRSRRRWRDNILADLQPAYIYLLLGSLGGGVLSQA